jgi:uncharacterized protein YdhG (YjbR/CyaY superfamily)
MDPKSTAVDDFIKLRVRPELHPVVELLRRLMREEAPAATEVISYGIAAYRLKRIIAVISPTQKDITFSLSHGSRFEDNYGLLKGKGVSSKHIKIKNVKTVNTEAIRYYIRQAVDWDNR